MRLKKGARFASIDRNFTTNIRSIIQLIHVWISTLLRLKSTFEYQMSQKYRRPFWMFPFHSPVAEFKIRNLCYQLLFSIIVPIQTTHNDVSIDTEHLNFLCISVFFCVKVCTHYKNCICVIKPGKIIWMITNRVFFATKKKYILEWQIPWLQYRSKICDMKFCPLGNGM